MIALDTNVCIAYLEGEVTIRDALLAYQPADIVLPSVVVGELFFGAYNSAHANDNLRRVRAFVDELRTLVFDSAAADHYGRIRAQLQRSGELIGSNDMLTAASAIANGAQLATRNISEFERVVGLDVVAW